MASDLKRGAYSGKETVLYVNTGTYETPTWVEITRARNIQINRGPELGDVEAHGLKAKTSIPGYDTFGGSFEYLRRRGVDTVYNTLVTARKDGKILMLRHLNGPIDVDGSEGFDAPVLLGSGTTGANGGEAVMESFNIGLADAFDSDGAAVGVEDVVIDLAV